MTAKELMQKNAMEAHVENGAFLEKHYENKEPGRPASGSIYYYVDCDEITEFHQIDCDEYWCYTLGSPLELWLVDETGEITVKKLGVEDGCEPFVYVKKGTIFASRHEKPETDGTFLICLTVPRFSSDGFTLIPKDEMIKRYPQSAEFYNFSA